MFRIHPRTYRVLATVLRYNPVSRRMLHIWDMLATHAYNNTFTDAAGENDTLRNSAGRALLFVWALFFSLRENTA